MRGSTKKLLFAIPIMVILIGLVWYFGEEAKNTPTDGEYNYGWMSCSSFVDEYGNTYSANDDGEIGYTFAVVSITAEGVSGTSSFSTNPAKWLLYNSNGDEFEYSTATYHGSGYYGTEVISKGETVQFAVIFKVPSDTDYVLDYSSGTKVVLDETLPVDQDLCDPNA